MKNAALLYPVFVQVLLTFVLLLAMGKARVDALKAKEVRVKDIALGQQAWPSKPTQIANCFHNQLETPVLFYAVVAFALILQAVTPVMVGLAWCFVGTRIIHALIHTGSNNVNLRFTAFLAGVGLLMAMWAGLAVSILTASG
jgi:hypothetical protein